MAIKPKDILDTANKLIGTSQPTEADKRSAMSRCYYAMYHKVLSILDNPPPLYEKQGVHASLITYLESSTNDSETVAPKTLRSLGYQLKQAKDMRVSADYYLEETLQDWRVDLSVKTAESCFSIADKAKGL